MTTNSNDDTSDFEDLISVKEAAKILHVSESTVWRWIDRDILKAYRVGPKRVCLRRSELKPTLTAREKAKKPPVDLRKYFLPRYDPELSTEDVLTRAKALRDEQAARRQGRLPEREAWEDINEMRDERSEEI